MEENLVGTHPRDALLVLRQGNLERKRIEKRKKVLSAAYSKYNFELEQFAKEFLADENISLPPKQKEELAKIYASQCKKQIGFISALLPIVLTSFGLAVNYNLGFIALLFLVIPLTIGGISEIIEKFGFLCDRKILKTATAEEIKSLDTKNLDKETWQLRDTPWERTI